MMKKQSKRYYLGIDSGEHTGFALWDSQERKLIELNEYKLHQALWRVKDLYSLYGESLMVRVEDARQRKWFGDTPASKSKAKLQGVGSVKRDAVIWEEFLWDLGVEFQMVHPIKGGTKWSAEQFAAFTGYKGRTNEHQRDAACLVVGF